MADACPDCGVRKKTKTTAPPANTMFSPIKTGMLVSNAPSRLRREELPLFRCNGG